MSKKSWVENQLHTSLSKDILLLYKEQRRHEKLVVQLTTMLTDLIKVNLQREVPFDQQVAYLTSLQTQHLNSIDKFGKQESGILQQS